MVILQNRLNHTCNSLLGQPTAIVAILSRPAWPTATAWPIATAKILSGTQIFTPTAAPASTFTPPSPPFAQYLHPSITRDRLNYTFNSLAIGPESVQPTAITPPGMQLFTPTAPQLPVVTILQ